METRGGGVFPDKENINYSCSEMYVLYLMKPLGDRDDRMRVQREATGVNPTSYSAYTHSTTEELCIHEI